LNAGYDDHAVLTGLLKVGEVDFTRLDHGREYPKNVDENTPDQEHIG